MEHNISMNISGIAVETLTDLYSSIEAIVSLEIVGDREVYESNRELFGVECG